MKKNCYIILIFLVGNNLFAQRNVEQLKTIQESKSEMEFQEYFFTNTANFSISAITDYKELRKIEETALKFGIDLKIKEYVKSNKIYELTLEIKNGEETIVETFQNDKIPLNKIDIEFYKNGNPEASSTERKTSITIKKDKNNKKNGNEPRVIFQN